MGYVKIGRLPFSEVFPYEVYQYWTLMDERLQTD